jgi:hypothetical protein
MASRALEIESPPVRRLGKRSDRLSQRQLREAHLVDVALADFKP